MNKSPIVIISALMLILSCQTESAKVNSLAAVNATPLTDSSLPFQTAAKVVLLSYENRRTWDRAGVYNQLAKEGKLHLDTTRIKERIELTPAQQAEAFKILYTKSCATNEYANCYDPRHAFIFYDPDNIVIGFMEICFECSNFNMDKQFKLDNFCRTKFDKLKMFANAIGIQYFGQNLK